MLANLVAFSLYAFLPGSATAALPTAGIDRWLEPTLSALVSGRFIALFSLLFGVGFALQMQRSGSSPVVRRRYLRRLGALFVIGLLHGALWWGDVLRYYAVIGLMLLPAYRWPARPLLVLGMILIVVPQPLLEHLFSDAGPPLATKEVAFADAFNMFSGDQWPAMLRGNASFMGCGGRRNGACRCPSPVAC